MSEETKVSEETNTGTTVETVDVLKDARDANNTWTHEGKEYENFLVNKTGGIAVANFDDDGNKIAIIGAEFSWKEKDDILDALKLESKQVTDSTGATTNQSKDATSVNAECFRRIAQKGFFIDVEDNISGEQQFLNRDALLQLEEEMQSSVFRRWVQEFHLSQYFPKGISKLDILFKKANDSIFLLAKIGDILQPRHIVLFEFSKPPLDVRREFRAKQKGTTVEENGKSVWMTPDTVDFRMQQMGKYLRSVKGVTLVSPGVPFDDQNSEHKKLFRDNFNPIWAVYLTDKLFSVFDRTGK